jgi:hypothetical protein
MELGEMVLAGVAGGGEGGVQGGQERPWCV